MKKQLDTMLIAIAVVVAVLLLVLFTGCMNERQQEQMNDLKTAVHDLEHPTLDNRMVRYYECQDASTKADTWLKLPAWSVDKLVAQYMHGCAELKL